MKVMWFDELKASKRVIATRSTLPMPDNIDQVWCLDYLIDAISDERNFRVLGGVGQWSCEIQIPVADTPIGGLGSYQN